MDERRFDVLTRSLATARTRRGLLRSIAALGAGLLGARAAEAQVTQAQCGNVICAKNSGVCRPGCVCCVYPNGNSRCRPPQECTAPGTPVTCGPCLRYNQGTGTCEPDPAKVGQTCNPTQPDACFASFQCTAAGVCAGAGTPHGCGLCSTCVGGQCVPANEGGACDDFDACTENTVCTNGVCAGAPVADGTGCGVGFVCTAGVCGFCGANGEPCCSGSACNGVGDVGQCTGASTCQSGVCASTSLADGTGCGGTGFFCVDGACDFGCFIDGTLYPPGTEHPSNSCQVCLPALSATAWTTKGDGLGCDDGIACTVGICQGGVCAGFPVNDGTGCGDGLVCTAGVCGPCGADGQACCADFACDGDLHCDFSGVCGPCGAEDEDCCAGGACDGELRCDVFGVCHADGCEIGGEFYAVGDNPNQPCETCQPSISATAWTAKANGASCGDGLVCDGGGCGFGCFIDGAFYPTGTANPSNTCQLCLPFQGGTAAWTTKGDGLGCDDGNACTAFDLCQGGVCIGTPVGDGTGCGTGQVCTAGVCGP